MGSRQRQAWNTQGTRSTFLNWEVSLTSLVAELLEDKRLYYKTDQGRTAEMPGERRNKAWRGRPQAEGRPWRLLVTLLWEGLRAPDTTSHT